MPPDAKPAAEEPRRAALRLAALALVVDVPPEGDAELGAPRRRLRELILESTRVASHEIPDLVLDDEYFV